MAYPQIVEYNEAVQNPAHAFTDPELRRGVVRENNLGLPLVLSGGFALTYTVTTAGKKWAVRCFHREIPEIEQKYSAISTKLRALRSGYFVDFGFQKHGILVRQNRYPIVRMDWVEGDPLGVWLDKNFDKPSTLEKARNEFIALAAYMEREGIAHGDIQNGNVMMSGAGIRLIDYDGMYVPGLPKGKGSETGHKHFQHPARRASDYGPGMDRFSFIALDLSLRAVIDDSRLYKKYREGGETIVFRANDFADSQNSEIFRVLFANAKLKTDARHFSSVCDGDISAVPTLEDFLAGKNIPTAKARIVSPGKKPVPRAVGYISAFPVIDALDFGAALHSVGDRVELIGQIVEVKEGFGKRGRGLGQPYVFINFGPWRGSIVKVTIWSQGLSKFQEKPSRTWVGRWISVTGLIDPPFENPRLRYTHLSITVQEVGQIVQLSEPEARFRLASLGKSKSSSNRDVVKDIVSGSKHGRKGGPASGRQSPQSGTAAASSASRNRSIVDRYKRGTSSHPSAGSTQSPSYPVTPPINRSGRKLPWWVWLLIGYGVLLFLTQ